MRNWKDFFSKNKYDGLYEWTPISEAFYATIKKFIKKEDKILEFGSSTGHISYRLAKDNYDITLLDIRDDAIESAKNNFKKNNVKANFICANIFDKNNRYNLAWNSGLIQCFDDNNKDKLINKLSGITNRLLLFYPDVENPEKEKGMNEHSVPGVGNAKEYSICRIPEICYDHFTEIYHGVLEKNKIKMKYDMYWLFAIKD